MYISNLCPCLHSLTRAYASFPFVSLSALYIEVSSHVCQMNKSYNWEISIVSLNVQMLYTLLLNFLSKGFRTSLWCWGTVPALSCTVFCIEHPPGTVYYLIDFSQQSCEVGIISVLQMRKMESQRVEDPDPRSPS